ncbi:MAG: hypothetical protein QG577_890 [Thermodesulfobacteriota bacterium]|nr:hypothetical protein [Thermodesulfobacteriota bacterium]
MLKTVFREIAIFLLSITLLPVLTIAVLTQQHTYSGVLSIGLREVSLGISYSEQGVARLLIRLLTPYALIQAVRAYNWSQRSLDGRRWAHAYYASVLFLVGTWSLWIAWDLFHFMHALGDIPGELAQFAELEGANVILGLGSYILSWYCARTALSPEKTRARQIKETESSHGIT